MPNQTSKKNKVKNKSASAPAIDNFKKFQKFIPLGLVLFLSLVYISTMQQGVDVGDGAELQYQSVLLGICHPPGYAIELTFGKLFSMIPIMSVAWRINFMMLVCGVTGAMALYGAIKNITGSQLSAIISSLTLAFSTIYWQHSLVAEVYIFYACFLLLGIYTITCFIKTGKSVWLYLTALCLGVVIADRASELFVMPAFLLLWFGLRKSVKIKWQALVISAMVFILPFCYTVSYHIIRFNGTQLRDRDGFVRNQIVSGVIDSFPQADKTPVNSRLNWKYIHGRIRYCLGLNYSKNAKFDSSLLKADINKYAWMISGLGASGDRYPADNVRGNLDQGKGTSITIVGAILAISAFYTWRKKYGYVLFGTWLIFGNLFFCFWHHRWDNLTFTIPSLIGWAFLIGLATAKADGAKFKKLAFLAFIIPIFLLSTNYKHVDRSTDKAAARQKAMQKLIEADFPQDSVIVTTCWPAMAYRYMFYIEAERDDMFIFYHDKTEAWSKLIEFSKKNGKPVFIEANKLGGSAKKFYAKTPASVRRVGFVKITP